MAGLLWRANRSRHSLALSVDGRQRSAGRLFGRKRKRQCAPHRLRAEFSNRSLLAGDCAQQGRSSGHIALGTEALEGELSGNGSG